MINMQPAIKYEFFVKTLKTTTVEDWCKRHAKGKHVMDSGGWRDNSLIQERGVEFELLDDAKRFILVHNGELSRRRLEY